MVGTYRMKTPEGKATSTPGKTLPSAEIGSEGARRPPTVEKPTPAPPPEGMPLARLTSLDAYRGCIMILLAASGFGIARLAALPETAAVWHRPVATPEGTREATAEDVAARRAWWQALAFHFDHPAWHSDFPVGGREGATVSDWQRWGVSLWDLIQPAFMFMVGVAMPFSDRRRRQAGHTRWQRWRHALGRSLLLVLLGVFLATGSGVRSTQWVFTNVLAQIGLGYCFVYLLLGLKWWKQMLAGVAILAAYWACLQYIDWRPLAGVDPSQPVDHTALGASVEKGEVLSGRFAPWSKNANLAHAVDVWLLNLLRDPDQAAMNAWRQKLQAGPLSATEWIAFTFRRTLFANPERFTFNAGGYQTLNFIPSLVTMLMGALCGGLLLSPAGPGRKLLLLLAAAAACLVLGRIAGVYLCPIVKRIWTPSWTLFSGAYVIALLAGFYLLFEILPLRRLAFPLSIVGMNSLAMYLMGQLMRPFAREKLIRPHLTGVLETLFQTDAVLDGPAYWLHDEMFGRIVEPCAALVIFWLIALWLWRQKIFLRL